MSVRRKFIIAMITILVVIAGALVITYLPKNQPAATNNPPQSQASSSIAFSCSAGLTPYQNQKLGVEFCYPPTVTVNEGGITWAAYYNSPIDSSKIHPIIGYKILSNIPSQDILFSYTKSATVDRVICSTLYPSADQLIQGQNEYGLSYGFYRETDTCGIDANGNPTADYHIVNTSTGPFAYVYLGDQNYLLFAGGAFPQPSYVDGDLKQIVETVKMLP